MQHSFKKTNKARHVLGLTVALVVGFSPLLGNVNSAGAASQPADVTGRSPSLETAGGGRNIAGQENDQALKYWTGERMKKSQVQSPGVRGQATVPTAPADRGRATQMPPTKPTPGATESRSDAAPVEQALATAGTVAAAAATSTSEGYWQGSNTASPNRQIGHLFYQQWDATTRTWKNYNCSATVVNSENKSVVWTAGHCVYQTYSNVWNRNYVFCPGYRNGSCALGRWTPYAQRTTTQWQNSTCSADGRCTPAEFMYDFGALKMNAINGYRIANWVGSHGISFNGATYQTRYLFGYPMNKSNGEYLYYCYGTNTYTSGNLRLAPCGAGGGASGGPWLSQINSAWGGVVHSVNSHGDGTYLAGPYQGNVAQTMFANVRY